jgi:signal transduction histidine kinase
VIRGLRSLLVSFQARLVVSFAAVILLAIGLAGAVFVYATRDDREREALDRVAAASPAIYQQAFFALLPDRDGDDQPLSETMNALARDQDVRILIIGSDNTVLHDTAGRLNGAVVQVPRPRYGDVRRGFVSWHPDGAFPEEDLTFVSASSVVGSGGVVDLPFRIVLAVQTDTIAGAWLSLLPSLGLAAAVAVPLSALAALVLAQQVARPVRRLTQASEALARGDFSQRVEVERDDEMGRLARAFTVMTERVGQRESQMRALLANVSHDLKTPMTSITGYAQSLVDGTATQDDVPRVGEVIREEAGHVNRLLADLLYLGEIDAGQVVARRENVPLETLVERCVRRIEPAARERNIRLDVDVEPEAVLHDVDAEKVERALTNVVDNAAKFASDHGWIEVRGRRNGATVTCDVTNSGPSIPDQDVPRVFDRFFRGDRARRNSEGSGLGLAIARELVELHGGRLAVQNVPGGVSFTLVLPAA